MTDAGFLFLRDNVRWVLSGFLLFFLSSFGQTFFLSLCAGDIRREYALSHGEFSALYMTATLASALFLARLGQVVDRYSARRVALPTLLVLALAATAMALSRHVLLLFATLFLLRLSGQGMMSHLAFTLMGRWFSARRGRAVALATLGLNTGEALLPLLFVALSAALGWRGTWGLIAGTLVLALGGVASLLAVERVPRGHEARVEAGARVPPPARDWTRAEVLREPLFYPVLLAMVPPAFIGNTLFFHQVHLAELRGWPPGTLASAFPLYAAMTVVFALVSGQLVDRFSARALLPFYLLPLGSALLLLALRPEAWSAFAFMGLYGITNGFSLSLFGALWPELFGVKHLGSIRAVIVPVLVFASAVGPGLAGFLIDGQVGFTAQLSAMGISCIGISLVMLGLARRVSATTEAYP